MSGVTDITVSHFGLCVSDLDRSLLFYSRALGFEFSHGVDFGKEVESLTELPGIMGHARFMTRGGVTVELLKYTSPDEAGAGERRAMNQPGISHLSLVVIERRHRRRADRGIRRHCAAPHANLHARGDMMFCTDPDGTRIELWGRAG